MPFMEPEIYTGRYVEYLGPGGETYYLPEEYFSPGEYYDDCAERGARGEFEIHDGILGRLSASGYLDCTEWTPYDSEEDAESDLRYTFGSEDDGSEDEDDEDEDETETKEGI